MEKEVEEFVKGNLKIEVKVKKAYKVKIEENKVIVIANLDNWEQKREIMNNKKNLKSGIWIENDLTKEEREVQGKLRALAREEKEKGNKVKVGYRKIYIEDSMYRWNEKEKKLEGKSRR